MVGQGLNLDSDLTRGRCHVVADIVPRTLVLLRHPGGFVVQVAIIIIIVIQGHGRTA